MISLKNRKGFTLMELLVVIAIIGVLAGLIFPVAASAKKRAKQTQCMNNMYQIFTAVKQFQLDEHRYPEFIAGPVQWKKPDGTYNYSGNGTIVPLTENTGMVGGTNGGNGRAVSLYPEYITTLNTLKCPFQDLGGERVLYSVGPDVDQNGNSINGKENTVADPMYVALSSIPEDRRPFRGWGASAEGIREGDGALKVYKYSSYDWQCTPDTITPGNAPPGEAHYSPARADWDGTEATLAAKKALLPSIDLTRQLRWRTPPEDTVITWCSNHRNVSGSGAPSDGSNDVVLFLDGHVQLRPTKMIVGANASWDKAWYLFTP
jgi:prepilin-type N-terminal cleavage/methylation domain-containing protein